MIRQQIFPRGSERSVGAIGLQRGAKLNGVARVSRVPRRNLENKGLERRRHQRPIEPMTRHVQVGNNDKAFRAGGVNASIHGKVPACGRSAVARSLEHAYRGRTEVVRRKARRYAKEQQTAASEGGTHLQENNALEATDPMNELIGPLL
jgi:hypothetical protein